ncbi:MAG: histidinol-phosphate transaminase [Candidatus Wallacebacter cryptica]|jgi:histidinol-phosphate aminotransferase
MTIRYRSELDQITPYVPGKHIDEVKREYGVSDIIKLASNENPLGMGSKARSAILENLDSVHVYPDGSAVGLRNKLAKQLAVEPEQIIVGNGSDELIKLTAETYLMPGDEVIICEPTFSQYRFAAALMGAKIVSVPLDNYRYDLNAMAEQISEHTKIIFVCNPNNPTGTIVDTTELERFLSGVPKQILVVIDEAYYEYVRSDVYPQTIDLLQDYPNLLITRTFSKIHALAALRVGYGVADPSVINAMLKTKEPFNVNSLAQAAAAAALDDQDHLQRSIEVNELGKRYLYEQFAEMGLESIPTETNFVLVALESDADAVCRQLMARGVIIRSGASFGLPSCVRITIGTMEQNRRMMGALKEVLACR